MYENTEVQTQSLNLGHIINLSMMYENSDRGTQKPQKYNWITKQCFDTSVSSKIQAEKKLVNLDRGGKKRTNQKDKDKAEAPLQMMTRLSVQ